jgi:ribose/xylose/arabinose/galactoside ABC-type transport system permease subunit
VSGVHAPMTPQVGSARQATPTLARRQRRVTLLLEWLERLFLLLIIGILVIIFWRTEPGWLNSQTVQFLLTQNASLEVVALGMTFAMVAGNIDLSPGSMISLAGMVVGIMTLRTGSLALGLGVGFVLVLGVGWFTGVLVGRLGISAIVVTLATYVWAAGLGTAIHGANAIPIASGLFNFLNDESHGWTVSLGIVAVCYVAGHVILTRTKLGRYARAIGGNSEFASRAGIPVKRYVIFVFLFMGLMIWLGTVLSLAQLGASQSSAGSGLELEAIVAVVIGGTSLTGGSGSVVGTALGVALLAVLNDGLSNLGLSDAYYDLWEGIAVIAILALGVVLQALVRRARAAELVRASEVPIPAAVAGE